MKWTVVIPTDIENELAAIWLRDDDKESIRLAADRLERELVKDPDQKGSDYYGDRIIEYGPLAMAYQLQPDDRLVRIFQVIRIREKH